MTEYMPRSAWTSSARGGARLTGSQLVGLACHWPGSSTSAYGVESASDVAGRLRGWRRYHVNGRGWSDIGYNFAIDQAGRVWDLRGSGRVGAHAASSSNPNANHQYVGVLFVIGANEEPTDAMLDAWWGFARDVFLDKWPGRTEVRGHGDVPGASTACPGRAISDLTDLPIPTEQEEDDMAKLDADDKEWIRYTLREVVLEELLRTEVVGTRQAEEILGDPATRGDTFGSLLAYAAAGGIASRDARVASAVWGHEEPNPASSEGTPTRMSQFVRSTWNATHDLPDHIDEG